MKILKIKQKVCLWLKLLHHYWGFIPPRPGVICAARFGYKEEAVMKNLILLLVLTLSSLSALSKSNCEKPQLTPEQREKLDRKIADKILQLVLARIDFQSSAININGIVGKIAEKNKLSLDVEAYIRFDKDIEFKLGDDEVELPKECTENERFSFAVKLASKNLWLKVKLKNEDQQGQLEFSFNKINTEKGKISLVEKPLELVFASNLNARVLEFYLYSLNLQYTQTEENKISLNSTCKLEQSMGNILSGVRKPVLAKCYLKGVVQDWVKPDLEYGIVMPSLDMQSLQ